MSSIKAIKEKEEVNKKIEQAKSIAMASLTTATIAIVCSFSIASYLIFGM